MIRWISSLGVLACLVVCGCSGSTKGQLPTFKASGSLAIDGSAFGPCTITFQPTNLTKESRSAVGQVGPDGTFKSLRTYRPDDGIPEGDYDVKLAADAMSGKDVPGTKPKTVTVKKQDGGKIQIKVDLESTGTKSDDLPRMEGAPPAAI